MPNCQSYTISYKADSLNLKVLKLSSKFNLSLQTKAARSDNNITTDVFRYKNSVGGLNTNASLVKLSLPDDSNARSSFVSRIRNTRVRQNPQLNVPRHINRRVYVAIATTSINCTNPECLAVSPMRFIVAMTDMIFQFPRIDILQAYYNMSINGVFTKDFPLEPPELYIFTGQLSDINPNVSMGTRAVTLNYGEAVEIVFQATQFGARGSHPLHLHGFSFYEVGTGSGNFNNVIDPKSYNLVDTPLINTVHVPARGLVALRIFANNPGKV